MLNDDDEDSVHNEEALPSASTFSRQSRTSVADNFHRSAAAAADGALTSPRETGVLAYMGETAVPLDTNASSQKMQQAKNQLRGSLRSRVRKQVSARDPACHQSIANDDGPVHHIASDHAASEVIKDEDPQAASASALLRSNLPATGLKSVLRSTGGPPDGTKKGISFSARDQVAKFSQYDSPTTIYMAGEEPLDLQSPVSPHSPMPSLSPAKTVFRLDKLEAEYGVDVKACAAYNDDDDSDGDEDVRTKESECSEVEERAHDGLDQTEVRAVLQGQSKESQQQERVRQRAKQQELLRQLQHENSSRVAPVRRASRSAVAEVAIGSLRIAATVAEFGLARGELPLSLQGVPVVRTDPMYAETAVTNNPLMYRGAVAIVRRGGGVSFAKKAKRVQDAGAVGCIIVNEEDEVMERVAAKAGDIDARHVDIPVLCVALCAGEALLAMLPATLSVRIWLASTNKERSEAQRTLAGGGVTGVKITQHSVVGSQRSKLASERTVRKQLIVSLQTQLREMETAKTAAEASIARLEERLAGAARTAARERDKQSTMLVALDTAQQAQALAEEARDEAQEKARLLEKENERLMERLAVYTREESEDLTLRLSLTRGGKSTAAADEDAAAASRSSPDHATNNGTRRHPVRLRKPVQTAADSAPNQTSDNVTGSSATRVDLAAANVAVCQSPVSPLATSLVSDALQQLHDAVEAQVINKKDNKVVAVEEHHRRRRRPPPQQQHKQQQQQRATAVAARAGAVAHALTPDRNRQLCGDGDRLVLRHVASVLGTSPDCRDTQKPDSKPRPLQSTTNRHNATGWIRQPREICVAAAQVSQQVDGCSPGEKCPQSTLQEPNQQENEVCHIVNPSLHYNRDDVASVGGFSEFSGPDHAEDEDWAEHARRVAAVLRRGHSASTLASSAPGVKTNKKRQAVSTRVGNGWNNSVCVGAF